jgi:hypothetical protein
MSDIPAFPTVQYANGVRPSGFDNGMTLLDYFAAKAMQGWLANPKTEYGTSYEKFAKVFYEMADAMMKARME